LGGFALTARAHRGRSLPGLKQRSQGIAGGLYTILSADRLPKFPGSLGEVRVVEQQAQLGGDDVDGSVSCERRSPEPIRGPRERSEAVAPFMAVQSLELASAFL
jgi:hypothetical protein